jgi:putative heme-binding domain-containing protein
MKLTDLCLIPALCSLASALPAAQPRTLAEIPDAKVDAEQAAFIVPEGFEINLWASEPMLRKPVQINWDAQGRLWVVSSSTYPQIKPGEEAIDEVVVLEDTNADGKADKSTVFASGLNIPTAVLPADGGCYVANSTEILFLKDTDGDGKADKRQVIFSGFGTEDTHHLIHTLRHGPDGMMHFNQSIYIHSHVETPWGVRRLMGGGIWEFRPQTRKLEVIAKGLINPWGFEFDRWGQSFATDGAGSEGINYIFPGAVFATSPGAKRIMQGLNPGQPKQCGLEIIEEPHFPDDWQGTLVTCDFRGNRINRFQLTESGSGYVSKQLPDVLASTHRGFRPIDVRTGPDGALYIADWYNPIIQHGEVDFRDPRRDRTNGRIWRVTAKGRPLSEKVEFSSMNPDQLLEQLKSPRRWNRSFAKLELQNKEPQLAAASVDEWALSLPADADPRLQLEAAWARETLRAPDKALLGKLLTSKDHRVRAAALRILSRHLEETPDAMKHLQQAITDDHMQVRLWAVACLRLMHHPVAVALALQALDKPMDNNLDFLLEQTCREQADMWLPVVLRQQNENKGSQLNLKHLIYALKATGKPEALPPLLTEFTSGKLQGEDAAIVLAMAGDVAGPQQLDQLVALNFDEKLAGHRVGLLDALVKAATRGVRPASPVTETTSKLLNDSNEEVKARAALLAGSWKQESARETLSQWASDNSASPTLRSGAFRGLTLLGGEPTRTLLVTLAKPEQPATTRVAAISGMSELNAGLAAKLAVEFLSTAKSAEEAKPVLEAFLKNKKLPPLLAKELEGKTIPDFASVEGIRLASSKGMQSLIEDALRKAGQLKQMDKPLTPDELQAMVTKVKQNGDAARGESIYRRQQLLCMSCHAIGETGGLIGPNMVSLGSSAPVDYIIESLLEPSKKIKEGYHMTMITLKDGQIAAGAIAQDSGDEIVLRDAANQLQKLQKSSIAQKVISPMSMMPPGLTASLREDEFIDLVKFLSELGREGDYKTQPNVFIRNWRTMGVMEQGDIDHVRHTGLPALSDRAYKFPWEIRYSLVKGDLPVEELPAAAKMYPWFPRIVQADLELASAGKVKLKLSATKGVLVVTGEKLLPETTEELVLDLPAGKTVVSFVITKEAAELKQFRVELLEGAAKVVTKL